MSCIVVSGSEVEKQLLSYYDHLDVHYKLSYGKIEIIYQYCLSYQGHGIYGYEWKITDYVLSYDDSKYAVDKYKNITIDDQGYIIQPLMIELMNQYIHEDFVPTNTEGFYVRQFVVAMYTSLATSSQVKS
jgi:hypothetical protein